MSVALLTTFLTGYRIPLFERLATGHGVEVLCYGGGERYVPAWFSGDLDRQCREAPFPARRLTGGAREAFALSRSYDAVIAPYAGGAIFPAAYLGARRHGTPFILWASVWAQPWSLKNAAALPLTRQIYRDADAVIAYGEHVRRFVAGIRGHDDDVFLAPQSVEPELFGRTVARQEVRDFRARHALPDGPLVLFAGRLVPEKGVEHLLHAWSHLDAPATLIVIGDGPLRQACEGVARVRWLGTFSRPELPVAYAAAAFAVLPSVPTRRFREPWGLVCNEAMHQGRPVIATTAVGAAAGGLVRDGDTGIVVAPGDAHGLAAAIAELLSDETLRHRLGRHARQAVAAYTYDAMVEGFDRALALTLTSSASGPDRGRGRSFRQPRRRRP